MVKAKALPLTWTDRERGSSAHGPSRGYAVLVWGDREALYVASAYTSPLDERSAQFDTLEEGKAWCEGDHQDRLAPWMPEIEGDSE